MRFGFTAHPGFKSPSLRRSEALSRGSGRGPFELQGRPGCNEGSGIPPERRGRTRQPGVLAQLAQQLTQRPQAILPILHTERSTTPGLPELPPRMDSIVQMQMTRQNWHMSTRVERCLAHLDPELCISVRSTDDA